jgi:hypothetical protein
MPYVKYHKVDIYHLLVLGRNLRKDSMYNASDSIYRIALSRSADSLTIRKIAREYSPLLNDMGRTKEAREWADIGFSNVSEDNLNVIGSAIVHSSYYLVSYFKEKKCKMARIELLRLDSLARLDAYSIYPRKGILYNDSMIQVMCSNHTPPNLRSGVRGSR